jgi:site-specific DNA-methyltransferase (adenine-specific)
VVLDGSQADALDAQTGVLTSGLFKGHRNGDKFRTAYSEFKGDAAQEVETYGDSGGASRFFPTFRYEAKAPSSERPRANEIAHPTVKPLDLMRWLVRLVTPRGGTVLDMFAGSGTTGEACILEGFLCILIEQEADYLPLIIQRISKPLQVGLGLDFGQGIA